MSSTRIRLSGCQQRPIRWTSIPPDGPTGGLVWNRFCSTQGMFGKLWWTSVNFSELQWISVFWTWINLDKLRCTLMYFSVLLRCTLVYYNGLWCTSEMYFGVLQWTKVYFGVQQCTSEKFSKIQLNSAPLLATNPDCDALSEVSTGRFWQLVLFSFCLCLLVLSLSSSYTFTWWQIILCCAFSSCLTLLR